jgi:hypothetical protein
MGAPHQFPQHHCGAPDSGAERNHNDILRAPDRACILFAKQGHPSIILYSETKSELVHCPLPKIEMNRIFIFFQCGENATVPHIYYSRKSDCNTIAFFRGYATVFQESPKHLSDARQKRFERSR